MVAKAKSGNVPAFSELVRRHHTRTLRFLLRRLPIPDEAEDLAQETFIEAYRTLHAFRGGSRFSTWLLGIALNISRNHCNRARHLRHPSLPEEALVAIPDPSPGPHERVRCGDRLQVLQAALDRLLTEELREALVLVSMEGMNYEDAARVAGIPVGTMKTRVFRARRLLRDGLESEGLLDLFQGD
ncbi:MAG: RNA polymerase sigma factor [Magnetococcales bacterium]|nr:RNA polymerase sigma factor [Magnetococcales bacterium]